jgi:ribosomal protein S11
MTMTPNTFTQLNESYKILYADRLKYLLPENFRYHRDVGTKKGRLGRYYAFPLVLKQEQGFTYAKYDSGEVTFNDTVPGIIKEAIAYGYQLFGWCGIDFETAAKGANSKTSFVDSVGHIIESLYLAAQRRIEISGWYGQAGLARVSAVDNSADYVTITDATWAPAMWIGAEGAWIKFSDHTTTDYSATITNATCLKISKVDMANKRLYLTTTGDGDATTTSIAAGNIISFYNTVTENATPASVVHAETQGIHAVLAGPTTLYGLTRASYSLLQGTSVAVGSTVMSLEAVQDAAAQGISKGMEGKVNLYLNPASVAKMITDFGGLRRFMSQEGNKYTVGANDITIHCQGLLVSIVAHPFIWEGYGYMFNPEIFKRIQAYPLSSKVPGRGDDLFHLTDGKGSYSMQLYSNEGLACDAPCQAVYFSGIVN